MMSGYGTFGDQKTLVMLVNFTDNRTQPYTVAQARTGYAAADAWVRQVSYRQTSLNIDIIGWYALPMRSGCDFWGIQAQADSVVQAAGVDLSVYVRKVYAFPTNSSCNFVGLGTVGGLPSIIWINGNTDTGTLAHEIGHTLGLYHSNAIDCHPTVLTPPCTMVEYGDRNDAMGGSNGHYNAFQKQRLGWLGFGVSPPITQVVSSGTYTIDAYEMPGTEPKALVIARGSTGDSFYVELRRPLGYDALLSRTGVLVHMASSLPDSSALLDMTPSTSPLRDDSFLEVGKAFKDPVTGITITTVAIGELSATIKVDMGELSCVAASPTITGTPPVRVQAGSTALYTVLVRNADSTTCLPSGFRLLMTAQPKR
jgi:M6 family metalloprotease-like protein